MDEEGLSLLLLQVHLGLYPLLSNQYYHHHFLLFLPFLPQFLDQYSLHQLHSHLLYKKHFVWDEAITAILKVAWEKLCADRYADFTYRMRKSGKKQQCVSQEI
ncbi:hypothetical protein JCGZ_06830 [Jatropha curcas]|uniref:Uncharacterized protein n=1 Tax=Jatropha curcas TaxID=180498 RepID=A0A067KMA9_JATCU|nr:hypothetical protein JCGZ_06830 [Jatropha curcas]